MAKKGPAPGTVGRPKLQVDFETVDKLLLIQCTHSEIAAFVGVSEDTLERRTKETHGVNFAEYSKQKRGTGRASLRRRQWLKAVEEGNTTMLIWLGKQYLDQSDKTQTEVVEIPSVSYQPMDGEPNL